MKKVSLVQSTLCVGLAFSLSACIVSRKREEGMSPEQARAQIERDKQQAQMDIERQKQQAQMEIDQQRKQIQDEMKTSAAAPAKTASTMVSEIQDDLRFPVGSAALRPSVKDELKELGTTLSKDPNLVVVVEGYTDNTGSKAINQKLSRDRAKSVKDVLVGAGVKPDQIKTKAMGTENPIADNNTSSGRAENRRAELKIQQAGITEPSTGTQEQSGTGAEVPTTSQQEQDQQSST